MKFNPNLDEEYSYELDDDDDDDEKEEIKRMKRFQTLLEIY